MPANSRLFLKALGATARKLTREAIDATNRAAGRHHDSLPKTPKVTWGGPDFQDRKPADISSSAQAMTLWGARTVANRRTIAHAVAAHAQQADSSDPNTYDRVASRLLQGVECPQDYGWSPEGVAQLVARNAAVG